MAPSPAGGADVGGVPAHRQAPNGMIFPDKATIYIAAIEDGDYRTEKIDCASCSFPSRRALFLRAG